MDSNRSIPLWVIILVGAIIAVVVAVVIILAYLVKKGNLQVLISMAVTAVAVNEESLQAVGKEEVDVQVAEELKENGSRFPREKELLKSINQVD